MTPPKPTSLPTPQSIRPAPPMPTLKKKEKEEKKGSGVPLAGGASSSGSGGFFSRLLGFGRAGGGSLARGGAATVGRSGLGLAGKVGFGPMLVNFLASNLGALILTGLVTGGAVYTLYSLGMNAIAETPAKSSVFPTAAKAASGEVGEARVDASGLSYFQTANQGGAFADPTQAATKDAPAGDKTAEAAAGADEGKVPDPAQPPDISGPQIADALAKHLEKPKMVASGGRAGGLGVGNGLAGGAGLAGGMTKKFDAKADTMKKEATAMRRDPAAKLTARRMSPIRGAKGGAKDQLHFANSLSRKALGNTSSEGQSFTAAEAFNTAPTAQGAKDVSKGMSDGGKGIDPSASDSDGGPLSTRTGEEPAPGTGQKEDKSPYSQALMMAMALLMTASTIILIIGILALLKDLPIIGVIAAMWQKILYGAAIGMAAAASGIGAMVASQHGQKDQGLMVTIGGAITTAAATAALMMPGPESAWVAVLGGIAGIGASIGSLLLPMMGGGAGAGSGGNSSRGTK